MVKVPAVAGTAQYSRAPVENEPSRAEATCKKMLPLAPVVFHVNVIPFDLVTTRLLLLGFGLVRVG
jgi:hypothetical protein